MLPPYGGWAKWKGLGIDQSYLPLWLKDQGYNTYYVGKVSEGGRRAGGEAGPWGTAG